MNIIRKLALFIRNQNQHKMSLKRKRKKAEILNQYLIFWCRNPIFDITIVIECKMRIYLNFDGTVVEYTYQLIGRYMLVVLKSSKKSGGWS